MSMQRILRGDDVRVRPTRRQAICGMGASLAALALGCRPAVEPLVLALVSWPASDLYFLAQQLGYYDGLPLRILDFTNPVHQLQAFRNGVVTMTPSTLDEAISLLGEQSDVRVVLVEDWSAGADALIAQADIVDLAGLRGKRIGYEASALGGYVFGRVLEFAGLTEREVTGVHLQIDEHERAFLEHRVDAVVTYEPVLSRLLAGGGRKLFDSTQIPGEIADVLVTREGTVREQGDLLTRLVDGWFHAADHLRTHPSESARILAPRLGVEPERVAETFVGIQLLDATDNRRLLGSANPEILPIARRLAERMVQTGRIPGVPDLAPLLDRRVVERLAP